MVNVGAWALSLVAMIAVILSIYPFSQMDTKSTSLSFGLYFSLSHVIWPLAICYIIFANHFNYGGFINCFLSHPFWQPLSRLSFAIFLLHSPVLNITMANIKPSSFISEVTLVCSFALFLNHKEHV